MRSGLALLTIVLTGSTLWAQAPAQPAAPALTPSQRAAREIPARILDFKVDPASIQPGQSVTLIWHTENPTGVTIDPEPGRVMPRGSRVIRPQRSTTYTLTVRGQNDQLLTRTVTVSVAGTAPRTIAGAADSARPVPRTADGKPDLSGVYGGGGGGARGARGAGAPAGPVLKAGAEKYRIQRGPDDVGATANCMPLIPPQSWGVPYQFQIVQGANYVVILHEYPMTFRIIPTDGTPHQVDPDPSWLGDSVGHWEGDTLVVDTIGFNAKTELQGYRHTDNLHMIEKFRRADYETIQYEATIEDPGVFDKPWVITRTFALRSDLKRIDEFVCENNRDYRLLFGNK